MSYIGRGLQSGAFRQLDDISSGFDGSDTTHTMQVNSTNVTVGDVNQILLSLGGVIQKPGTDFTVSSSVLTFTTAPAANTSFFAILLGSDNGGTVTPTDGSVTTGKIVDDAVTAAKVASSGAFAIGATGTSSSLAGIPFFSDTSNKSMYTHDVSGTDSTAAGNTAFGFNALDAITTGDDNTAIGENALSANNTASNNVAVGKNAGLALTSGDTNTAVGANALRTCTVGDRNVAIGTNAFYDLEPSSNSNMENVAIGFSTGRLTTTGEYNTFLGAQAGYSVTTGGDNTLIGRYSGANFDTENHNLAIGRNSLSGSVAGGEYNTAVGNYSLDALTSGDYNVAVGYNSGGVVSSGSTNTLIGVEAGYQLTSGSNNTLLGLEAGRTQSPATVTTGSDNIVLGNNSVTNAYIKVDWTVTSDKRDKTDVKEFNMGLDFVNALNPVTYRWDMRSDYPNSTPDGTHKKPKLFSGLIAQDVEILEREYGYKVEDNTAIITSVTEDGNYGLNYSKFVPV